MHSSGVRLRHENKMKVHDALVGQFTNTFVWQENHFKWAYQIMERRTPSPMVNILKGHGPFTTPSIIITPHPNPFPNRIEWLITKQISLFIQIHNGKHSDQFSLISLSIQILTHLVLKDTLGGNSPKHQNMQYLTHNKF